MFPYSLLLLKKTYSLKRSFARLGLQHRVGTLSIFRIRARRRCCSRWRGVLIRRSCHARTLRLCRAERLDESHDLQQMLFRQLLLEIGRHQRLTEAFDNLRLRAANRVAYVVLIRLDSLAAF